MSLTTVWTHGNSLVVEDPGEYQSIRHRGYAAELTFARPRDDEDPDNLSHRYCHIPIPSPASVDGASPSLTNVYVLYQTLGFVTIDHIYVYDANNLLATFPTDGGGLIGYGDHLTLGPSNKFTLPEPYVLGTGIGITLSCSLNIIPPSGNATDSDAWVLNVTAAGADFVFPRAPLGEQKELTDVSFARDVATKFGTKKP